MYGIVVTSMSKATTDQQIVDMIISRFFGQLRNYGMCLSEQARRKVRNTKKEIEISFSIETITIEYDVVNTLILTDYLHFIGTGESKQKLNKELLLNLKCRTL